jgi:hypothetical protein
MLLSSWRVSADDSDKKAGHRGEHEGNRKTIARGMSGDSSVTVVTSARALYTTRYYTRCCGRTERPASPAPSELSGRNIDGKPRAKHEARSRSCVCNTPPVVPAKSGRSFPEQLKCNRWAAARTVSACARDGRATRHRSRDHHRPGIEVTRRELSYDAKWTFRRTPIGFNSFRPVAVRIICRGRVAAIGSITPIPATPTASKAAAVTPEVAASGDVGSANVHMGAANVHAGPASAEVPAGKVTAAEVAPTKVTASVSAASMTASTTSKGRCRDCRTTQKDSGDGYEQCFSHQDLHHSVSSTKLYRRVFSVIDAIFRTMSVDDRLRPAP